MNIGVVDLGGCTIDVSVFNYVVGKCPQLLDGNAIAGGGSYVNKIFIDLLKDFGIYSNKNNSLDKLTEY